jgi:hypothetical protein
MPGEIAYDDLGLVDCALCGRELLGERTARRVRLRYAGAPPAEFPPALGGRAAGRPYCAACLAAAEGRARLGWCDRR